MDEYLDRLGRVLDVDVEVSEPIQVMTIPRPRDRRTDIERQEINMLDFLSLYGCELQIVVGERNSILGRVMTPLNQLRYQLRFIDKATQCLPRVEKTQLRKRLEEAIIQKKAALPSYLWNALWSGEPMASLLTQSKGLFPADSKKAAISVLQADLDHTLKLVNDIQTGKLDTDLDTLGEIQQRWVFNHQPGQ